MSKKSKTTVEMILPRSMIEPSVLDVLKVQIMRRFKRRAYIVAAESTIVRDITGHPETVRLVKRALRELVKEGVLRRSTHYNETHYGEKV